MPGGLRAGSAGNSGSDGVDGKKKELGQGSGFNARGAWSRALSHVVSNVHNSKDREDERSADERDAFLFRFVLGMGPAHLDTRDADAASIARLSSSSSSSSSRDGRGAAAAHGAMDQRSQQHAEAAAEAEKRRRERADERMQDRAPVWRWIDKDLIGGRGARQRSVSFGRLSV